jgi:hypothetical protein
MLGIRRIAIRHGAAQRSDVAAHEAQVTTEPVDMPERKVTRQVCEGRTVQSSMLETVFDTAKAKPAHRALAGTLLAALTVLAWLACNAAAQDPVSIAVFEFELNDTSAGGGIVAQDATDTESLHASTDEARRMLSASGLYRVVDTSGLEVEVSAAGRLQDCNGCEAPLAQKLGADQSMFGVVNRVSRTEYTMHIYIRDAESGEALATGSTPLRMGANYSWPRGVEWLLEKFLPAEK